MHPAAIGADAAGGFYAAVSAGMLIQAAANANVARGPANAPGRAPIQAAGNGNASAALAHPPAAPAGPVNVPGWSIVDYPDLPIRGGEVEGAYGKSVEAWGTEVADYFAAHKLNFLHWAVPSGLSYNTTSREFDPPPPEQVQSLLPWQRMVALQPGGSVRNAVHKLASGRQPCVARRPATRSPNQEVSPQSTPTLRPANSLRDPPSPPPPPTLSPLPVRGAARWRRHARCSSTARTATSR